MGTALPAASPCSTLQSKCDKTQRRIDASREVLYCWLYEHMQELRKFSGSMTEEDILDSVKIILRLVKTIDKVKGEGDLSRRLNLSVCSILTCSVWLVVI